MKVRSLIDTVKINARATQVGTREKMTSWIHLKLVASRSLMPCVPI